MKLFFDTEFTGLQKDTTLISLGIIADNDRCFYAKLTDYNEEQVNDWIEENVLNNLELADEILDNYDVTEVEGDKEEVKEALLEWLNSLNADYFELVSDVSHYDMILFIDLFGTAFDLPENISPWCYDIVQDIYYSKLDMSMYEAFDKNREELLKELTTNTVEEIEDIANTVLSLGEDCKHNSLYDALVIKALYEAMAYGG
jgi:hypothetical protein